MQTEEKKGRSLLKQWLSPKVVLIVLIAVALLGGAVGVGTHLSSQNKMTQLGFEDIGELATQSAYCTEVNVTEAARDFFGITIPFTQSKYIYSYDVVIKAGIDFSAVRWEVGEDTIRVYLPEVKILGSELNLDSFKVYHEAESIFRPITLEETNQAVADMVKSAEQGAVENGLLDEARSNAETILRGFFANVYDPETYSVTFIDQKKEAGA